MSILMDFILSIWLYFHEYLCPYYASYVCVLWYQPSFFLLVIEWSLYLWPNRCNGSWCAMASMVLSDSQLSMRPLCSELLIAPIDYTFAICLTKCMSWLVGAQSSFWKCIFFSTVISILFYGSKEMVQFWEVTWALGLKKWLKSQSCWHSTGSFGL